MNRPCSEVYLINMGNKFEHNKKSVRMSPTRLQLLDKILSEYDPRVGSQRIENMEMEASFLIHFLGGLGYWGGAICPTVANRRENTFDHHYQEAIKNATKVALLALATARRRRPEVRR
jgi:uridine phosphorylase